MTMKLKNKLIMVGIMLCIVFIAIAIKEVYDSYCNLVLLDHP